MHPIPPQLPNPPVKFTLALIEAKMCGSSGAAAIHINIDIFRPPTPSCHLVTFTFTHASRALVIRPVWRFYYYIIHKMLLWDATPYSPYIIHTQLLPLRGRTPSNLWQLITVNASTIFHWFVLCKFFKWNIDNLLVSNAVVASASIVLQRKSWNVSIVWR